MTEEHWCLECDEMTVHSDGLDPMNVHHVWCVACWDSFYLALLGADEVE